MRPSSKLPMTPHSPVSVVGFTCDSSDLQSPRSNSNTTERGELRSPVSLLSLLLHQQNAMHCGEDCYEECDDDDDDCYSDCDGYDGATGPYRTGSVVESGHALANAGAGAQRTAPVDVPSVMWLKEPQAVNELRRLHYERWHRRQLIEKEMELERAARANADAQALQLQQQQQRM